MSMLQAEMRTLKELNKNIRSFTKILVGAIVVPTEDCCCMQKLSGLHSFGAMVSSYPLNPWMCKSHGEISSNLLSSIFHG